MIHINGQPHNITNLQIYASSKDSAEENIKEFYADIEEALKHTPKKDIYIVRDFNVKERAIEE